MKVHKSATSNKEDEKAKRDACKKSDVKSKVKVGTFAIEKAKPVSETSSSLTANADGAESSLPGVNSILLGTGSSAACPTVCPLFGKVHDLGDCKKEWRSDLSN